MEHSSAGADRRAELDALVRAAASGDSKPVYLFTGETSEMMGAARLLLDALVPEARRAFNLETYDGRTTSMGAVLDSLRTPGFFAGTKVIWVRESPVFLSGEKRGDVTKALLAAWEDGREKDAAEKLLTLVAMAGWSQEQLRGVRWSSLPKTRIREVFGDELDNDQLERLDGIQAFCMARDLAVSAFRDDSGALLEFLDAGLPPHTVLLFTAEAVDARKRLVKRVREIGAVIDCSVQRERSGALTRETVEDLISRVTRELGKRLTAEARQLIVQRAGIDPAVLAAELEKLCLYTGEQATISADDVRVVVRDLAESWIFDFTGALTARQLGRALPLLRGLLSQGEPPLRLLAMIVREVRMLLLARECLDHSLRGAWRVDLPFNVFQARLLPQIDPETRQAFGNVHPFVLYRRFQDAARISTRALRQALVQLSDLDLQLKSSRIPPPLLLEAFVIGWCSAPSSSAPAAAVKRSWAP